MAKTYTPNVNLEKDDGNEFYDVGVQSRNMDKIDAEFSEKANKDGGNTFTGVQTIQDNVLNMKMTTSETVNKRWFNWSIGNSSFFLVARNDLGAFVRSIVEFFHDGGVRIFHKLTADGDIAVANNKYLKGVTTGGTERSLAGISTDNQAYFGDNSAPTVIQGSTIDVNGLNVKTAFPKQTLRDFTNGCLIATSIDYPVASGLPFLLEIKGNSYTGLTPVDTMLQGYVFNNTLHLSALGGVHKGRVIPGMVALGVGGKLHFWFPYQDFWAGYIIACWDVAGANTYANRVTAVTNAAKPSGTAEVALSNYFRRLSQDTGWKALSIPTGAWASNPGVIDGCNFTAWVSDATLEVGDVVTVEFGTGGGTNLMSFNYATRAGVSRFVYTGSVGMFGLYSEFVPADTLVGRYKIEKG